ncbi:TIGR02450 family Trp-rich protein [Undibacterium flavidum]|uniref:TIGR02450 family Trp-rich protein n=1 Tax=Undibacterium flavidum TaxID=2762297 RepID=A0ABR6Y6G7_9BURK|nr:TIGR02450 family Trp-rich protein [Undibacterium flavidum]MBC3872215.1 TIGR02450 family Trp-rich protein [Undibacterium flavidum]
MNRQNQEQSPEVGRPIKLNPKKLLLTKWSAVEVIAKQKHFLVSRVVQPDDLNAPIIEIEIEAVYSGNKRVILWRELQDSSRWKQGWV